MDALSSADGSTGSAEPVGELAGRERVTGAGPESFGARSLFVPAAALVGDWR
jgi:hypothetical protein